jgi:hypothetical protein
MCIKKFLENRTFTVKIDGFVTINYEITARVQQDAVLSPILFSININYIPINYNRIKEYSRISTVSRTVEKKINKD